MDSLIAIEIVPVIEGNDQYYKIMMFDLDADDVGNSTRVIRDIFHADSLHVAIALLYRFSTEGAFGP
jgi:hypothetical protein